MFISVDAPVACDPHELLHSLDMRAVARALSQTTERLAQELTRPSVHAPPWDAPQWRVAMASSVIHGTSALLRRALAWRGPPLWEAFLDDQSRRMLAREQAMRALLQAMDEAAREEGVGLVALKGGALLRSGLYAPGTRPMADIDLLVQPSRREDAVRALGRLGYEAAYETSRDLTLIRAADGHAPPHLGDHPDNPIPVELHSRVHERLPTREVDITRWVAPAAPPAGVNGYPGEAALMRHLLLHAVGNLRSRSLRLIQLHDIARLATRLGRSDWTQLEKGDGEDPVWWAWPVLAMVERCFPGSLAEAPVERLAAGCPPLLRRSIGAMTLTDLSASGLTTQLAPDLAWSGSLGEACRLAWRRLRPEPGLGGQGQRAGAVRAFERDDRWRRQPRWVRGLRVLRGEALRADTLYTLSQAFAWSAP